MEFHIPRHSVGSVPNSRCTTSPSIQTPAIGVPGHVKRCESKCATSNSSVSPSFARKSFEVCRAVSASPNRSTPYPRPNDPPAITFEFLEPLRFILVLPSEMVNLPPSGLWKAGNAKDTSLQNDRADNDDAPGHFVHSRTVSGGVLPGLESCTLHVTPLEIGEERRGTRLGVATRRQMASNMFLRPEEIGCNWKEKVHLRKTMPVRGGKRGASGPLGVAFENSAQQRG